MSIYLTDEDKQISKRGDCAGDINICDRMQLADSIDYRAMLEREQNKAEVRDAAEWRDACADMRRREGAWEDAGAC